MTVGARGWAALRPSRSLLELYLAYLLISALVVWQAYRRETPTIFTDELELTQLSRAIAETGRPARRGDAYGFSTLVPWFTAPFWWIESVSSAYAAVKTFQALVMAAAIFPAYAMARLVVSHRWALLAATATVAAPALAYAPILVEEPFAYPLSALALLLIMRATIAPTRSSIVIAALATGVAAATRSQLLVLVAVLIVTALTVALRTPRLAAWRCTWSSLDRLGVLVLALGAVVLFSSIAGSLSEEWRVTTSHWKGRIFEYGVWAVGGWSIGIGLIPAIALLALISCRRPRWAGVDALAFITVARWSTIGIAWYAALKGAYISTQFASLVVERNVIYLTPVAMAALVALLAHRGVPFWSVAAAAGAVGYVVTSTPTQLASFPYYEAHGLSILALANRLLHWSAGTVDTALMVSVVVAPVLLLATLGVRRRRTRSAIVASVMVCVVGWNLTNEIYAADGERDASDSFATNFGAPYDWLYRAADGRSVTILGHQLNSDPTGLWLTEFWNRNVKNVWSTDGSAGFGPGPTLTPDLADTTGRLSPSAGTAFAVGWNGLELVGPTVLRPGRPPLVRLMHGTLRLTSSRAGIYADGWTQAESSFNRFDGAKGDVTLTLSRERFCAPDAQVGSEVEVRVGQIVRGERREPVLGPNPDVYSLRVTPCNTSVLRFAAPSGPWRVEITSETFVPREVDPNNFERRPLGVVATLSLDAATGG